MHWVNTLANRDPALHDKLFALEGELINSHSHEVEVDKTVFNIPTTVVHIPTTAAILVAITTDSNIAEMGLYAAGNANFETVKVRKICPTPHTLGGLFLLDAFWAKGPFMSHILSTGITAERDLESGRIARVHKTSA